MLKTLIERNDLGKNVSLLPFVRDVAKFHSGIDCLVNPSFPAEPFGMSIIEAMAHGVPVIASRGGGPSEIIEDGVSGFLVEPNDDIALANTLEQIVASRRTLPLIAERAFLRVQSRFNLSKTTAQQQSLINELAWGA
jgi:glycosyltransferase involved in cell wall biosynthesis